MKLDRVLVPLDGSPLAERALRTALALLRERPSATVILMRAAQAATPGPWADPIEAEIKVSTHGRSGLRRMVLGSVAESVLRTAATPVLLVPADARHLPVASVPPRVAHEETIHV